MTEQAVMTQRLKNSKPFSITSVCRADMKGIFRDDEIEKLSDSDMDYIARKMSDAYCEQGFWIDMKIITQGVLDDKQRNGTAL